MSKYIVYFQIPIVGTFQSFETDRGPAEFSNGFWVDDDLKFSPGKDMHCWIPASQLLYIQKVKP